MNYEFNDKYDYFIRKEPYKNMDLYTLREVKSNYKSFYPLLKDKTVLDVGAHIGAFSKFALEAGAKKVVAYEPNKTNYDLLVHNLGNKVDCRNYGIGKEDSIVDFYESSGTCTTTHSVMPVKSSKRVKTSIEVKRFMDVLDEVRPDAIKISSECKGWKLD